MNYKYKKITIKKSNQLYLKKLLKKYPQLSSGRKNYEFHYKRVLKNILLSQAYSYLFNIQNISFLTKSNFIENKNLLTLKIKIPFKR